MQARAERGVAGGGEGFPHRAAIEASLGEPITARAHVGERAAAACEAIGAEAYTFGGDVAFRAPRPDLHTAAHEAAHTLQQGRGVAPAGGVGRAGDAHEREADAIADKVVRGERAPPRAAASSSAGPAASVQRKPNNESLSSAEYIDAWADHAAERVRALLPRFPFVLGQPYASWASDDAFAEALAGALGGGHRFLENARDAIAPELVEHVVDRGRPHDVEYMAPESDTEAVRAWTSPEGPGGWYDSVATEIALAIVLRVNRALPRVVERYAARMKAAMASGDAMPWMGIVHGHPVDRFVDGAIRRAGVELDYAEVPDEGPAADLHAVTVALQSTSGGHRWVRADPPDASAEQVAFALWEDPTRAHELIDAAPLWGLTSLEGLPVDRAGSAVGDLLSSDLADEAALNQVDAGDAAAPGAHAASNQEVIRTMRDSVQLFTRIIEGAGAFGAQRGLEAERRRVDERSQALSVSYDPRSCSAEVVQWAAHARRQRDLLRRALAGLDELWARTERENQLLGAKNDRHALSLPAGLRMATRDVALEFAGAARAAHLVGTAEDRVAEAETRLGAMAFERWRKAMHGAQELAVRSERGSPSFAGDTLRDARETRLDIAVLEAQMHADPEAVTDEERAEIETRAANVEGKANAAIQVATLHEAFSVLDEMKGVSTWVFRESDDIDALVAEGRRWKSRWINVYNLWQQGRREEADEELRALRTDEGFRDYLQRVRDQVDDAEFAIKIGHLAAMLGIALVTMGVGAWVGGAAEGALATGVATTAELSGWARLATIAVTAGAESITASALTQALLVEDPSIEGFLKDTAFDLGLFATLRVVSRALQVTRLGRAAADGGKAARASLHVAEAGAQVGVVGVALIAREEIARRASGRESLSAEEVRAIALESVGMYAMIVGAQRLAQPALSRFNAHGARIGGRIARDAQLRARLRELVGKAESGDPEVARELLRVHRRSLENELETLYELQRVGQEDPELLEATTPEKLRADIVSHESALGGIRDVELTASLETIGSRQVACPREMIPDLLARHDAAGAEVRVSGQDPVTGERTFRVRRADQPDLFITERIPGDLPGTSGNRAPTEAEARSKRVAAARAEVLLRDMNRQLQETMDAQPVVEVSRVIVGGSIGGVQNYATLPAGPGMRAPGTNVSRVPDVIAIGPEQAWLVRALAMKALSARTGEAVLGGGQIGQSASEYTSRGFTTQPGQTASPGREFATAQDVADAVTLTAFESGMARYDGVVTRVEIKQSSRPDWSSQKSIRLTVSSKTRGTFKVYTDFVDLTTGIGPAREARFGLGDTPPELVDSLIADGRVVHYDHHARRLRQGRALVIGGSATAVWQADMAASAGGESSAMVGRPPRGRALQDLYQEGFIDQPTFEKLSTNPRVADEAATLIREATFARARTERNVDILDQGHIDLISGEVVRANASESGRLVVELTGGRVEVVDQIVVAIGQNPFGGGMSSPGRPRPAGPPGPGALIRDAGLQLEMIMQGDRVVGLRSAGDPRVRLLGASMSGGMRDLVAERQGVVDGERMSLPGLLTEQANAQSVPSGSQGVPGSIHQVGQNVPAANREMTPPANRQSGAPIRTIPIVIRIPEEEQESD